MTETGELDALCEDYGIALMTAFGSVLHDGDPGDLDVAVRFSTGEPDVLALHEVLARRTGGDLMVLDAAGPGHAERRSGRSRSCSTGRLRQRVCLVHRPAQPRPPRAAHLGEPSLGEDPGARLDAEPERPMSRAQRARRADAGRQARDRVAAAQGV